MSHVTDTKFVVTDLDALEEALAATHPDLELVRGQKTYKWFGQWVDDFRGERAAAYTGHNPKDFGKCEHAIRVKNAPHGAYEIGVVKSARVPGAFDLLYDAWSGDSSGGGRAIERCAGTNLNKLRQEYTVASQVRTVHAKLGRGWKVERKSVGRNVVLTVKKGR